MSILKELLEEIRDDPQVVQLKKVCDKIFDEEKGDIEHLSLIPKGGNIFLALEINNSSNQEISFLCLEQSGPNEFVIVLLSKKDDNSKRSFRRVKTWEIKEEKIEKIVKEYASIYRYLYETTDNKRSRKK